MKRIFQWFVICVCIIMVILLGINYFVIFRTNYQIKSEEQFGQEEMFDCILILGAGVRGTSPSPMLEDRLLQGISLYQKGVAPKIIMSGDHGREEYDEVNVMKQFAIERGIPSEDIFMDHAGFSSYDSVYRAKEIFGVERMVVVTQQYHLYRALYIANSLDIEAYGVASNPRSYTGQVYREIREVLARDKDFVKCIFQPTSTYLGDTIPVSGNGDITNDKKEV